MIQPPVTARLGDTCTVCGKLLWTSSGATLSKTVFLDEEGGAAVCAYCVRETVLILADEVRARRNRAP